MEQFPDLAVAGSPLNAAFVAKYKAYQGSNYFDTPDWPMRLAKECAQATPVRSPASLADRLANTSWNDANKEDSQGNQKSFTLNPDMTVRANWRHKELGWWKVLDDTRIELHVAKNNSVHPVLTFNSDLTEATDGKNQSYQRLNPPVSRNIAQEQALQPTPTITAAKQAQTNQSIVPGLPNTDASAGTATPIPSTSLASQSSLEGAVADAEFQTEEHTKNGDAIRMRLKDESAGKLVVKGFFLGMNFDDCYAAFQPFGKGFIFIDKRDDTEEKDLFGDYVWSSCTWKDLRLYNKNRVSDWDYISGPGYK